MDIQKKEELCSILIEGYQAQLKVIASQKYQSLDEQSYIGQIDDEIHIARCVLQSWEEAQFMAMSLVKYNGERALYKSWCAFAAIQHWKSSSILLNLLMKKDQGVNEDLSKEKMKLEQKKSMLPRLAEMLMQKICSTSDTSFPPSADDWRIFKECCDIQGKYSEVIDTLNKIKCGTEKEGRQINDQNDINQHFGSLIQLSERERIEMISESNAQMNQYDIASTLHADNLLKILPDQWSYWDSLLKYSLKSHDNDYDAACRDCSLVLQNIMERQEAKGKSSRVPLRGPHLFRVHMTSERIRQSDECDLSLLCRELEEYGDMFSSQTVCCFQDLRPYLALVVQKDTYNKSNDNSLPLYTQKILDWTKMIWNTKISSFAAEKEGDVKSENLIRTQRANLRACIFSIKVAFELWYQSLVKLDPEDTDRLVAVDSTFMENVPSVDDLVLLWSNVLDLGSNPNDGGQKETLPGDDLILLAVQLLLHKTRKISRKEYDYASILAVALLEGAIKHSPYNPYLKIAAINIYVENISTLRASEIFQTLNINHIQLDSCSYIILRHLIDGGLYNEAVSHATKIINLHSTSAKDVARFLPKSFENGNLSKGLEMLSWQRYNMNLSIQLLEAKSIVMDLAPLLTKNDLYTSNTDFPKAIGARHGICGVPNLDIIRAEKIVKDSTYLHSAPSLLSLSNYHHLGSVSSPNSWSDNRDFTVNDYQILERAKYHAPIEETILSSHSHAILTRIVLLVDAAKAPKKGKIVSVLSGDEIDVRVRSVFVAMENVRAFIENSSNLSQLHRSIWKTKLLLCECICILSTGRSSINENESDSNDSLSSREEKCVEVTKKVREAINEIREAWNSKTFIGNEANKSKFICRFVPEALVHVYVILRITSNLYGIFNLGKRKRKTKLAAGSLAEAALSMKSLIETLSEEVLNDLPYSQEEVDSRDEFNILKSEVKTLLLSTFPKSSSCIISNNGDKDIIDDIITNKGHQRVLVRQKLELVFMEMINELNTFDVVD